MLRCLTLPYRYDEEGKARAFGAEARTPKYEDQAEDEQWHLAEYFKLHLHPSTMRATQQIVVEPLPAGVTLQQVYADFFGYLFKHTQTFFEDHEIGGPEIWANLRDKIEIVIAHPNGWGPQEQGFLRQAATQAGLVTSPALAHRQILFVSEAEASVHFVMLHADLEARLKVGLAAVVMRSSANLESNL